MEEPGVDHGGLRAVGANQVDGLGGVLLSLRGAIGDQLSDGDRVGEDAGDQALEGLQHLFLARVGGAGELPPAVDLLGLLAQHLGDALVNLPPVFAEMEKKMP